MGEEGAGSRPAAPDPRIRPTSLELHFHSRRLRYLAARAPLSSVSRQEGPAEIEEPFLFIGRGERPVADDDQLESDLHRGQPRGNAGRSGRGVTLSRLFCRNAPVCRCEEPTRDGARAGRVGGWAGGPARRSNWGKAREAFARSPRKTCTRGNRFARRENPA